MSDADVIVIGTGGVGSAALFHLARRGVRALGIDRFAAGHDRGSSHGKTRIIRQAYFEHADYVPLLRRSYALWEELQQQVGEQLYFPCGLLEIGPAEGVVCRGVLASASQYDLPVQIFEPKVLASRFPQFALRPENRAVFEENAGYLLVERCVQAHLAAAGDAGATWIEAAVSGLEHANGVWKVETSDGALQAPSLVVAPGAWAGTLLEDLPVQLRVVRKHLHWFPRGAEPYHVAQGCPAFFYETEAGYYYGMPAYDWRGVKVAEHSRGESVAEPLTVDRSLDPAELLRVKDFVSQSLPRLKLTTGEHAVCMYTMTPDDHFLVDRHPTLPNLSFAAGLSGHGFKFTTVLGEILADLALDGGTQHPIDFLACRRFV